MNKKNMLSSSSSIEKNRKTQIELVHCLVRLNVSINRIYQSYLNFEVFSDERVITPFIENIGVKNEFGFDTEAATSLQNACLNF